MTPKTTYNVKEFLYQKLCISGQKDLLKHLIRERLAQGGWLYALRWACIEYIKSKGTDKVNVSHMLSEMVPLGKKLFHQSEVRRDLRNVLTDFARLYFITDESALIPSQLPTPPWNAKNLFQYQSKDVKIESRKRPSPSNSSPTSSSTDPPVLLLPPPLPHPVLRVDAQETTTTTTDGLKHALISSSKLHESPSPTLSTVMYLKSNSLNM